MLYGKEYERSRPQAPFFDPPEPSHKCSVLECKEASWDLEDFRKCEVCSKRYCPEHLKTFEDLVFCHDCRVCSCRAAIPDEYDNKAAKSAQAIAYAAADKACPPMNGLTQAEYDDAWRVSFDDKMHELGWEYTGDHCLCADPDRGHEPACGWSKTTPCRATAVALCSDCGDLTCATCSRPDGLGGRLCNKCKHNPDPGDAPAEASDPNDFVDQVRS